MPDWGELLVDQLRFMAQRYGGEVAYRDTGSGGALTFHEWDARSNALARGLVARGVRRGDRVSIYLPNDECLRWIVAYAAVHKAGAVAVPTNTRLSPRELAVILGHCEAVAMVTCRELLPTALEVRREVPTLQLVVSAGGSGNDIVAYDDALDADGSAFQVPVGIDDLADVMYTSGTTGLPKGVAV